jgi:hypothetical protein
MKDIPMSMWFQLSVPHNLGPAMSNLELMESGSSAESAKFEQRQRLLAGMAHVLVLPALLMSSLWVQ